MPRRVQPAFQALWNLDLALADVVSTTSEAGLGAIRLAWWRERLDALDGGGVAAEPRLQAVAAELLPRGISGHELTTLEDAWLPLLAAFPWDDPQADGLRLRGRVLFGIGARLLGGPAEESQAAGALWSLADGAFHCSDAESRRFLLDQARAAVADVPRTMPREVRPLTVLAALATHDLRRASRLRRGAAAIAHRIGGKLRRS